MRAYLTLAALAACGLSSGCALGAVGAAAGVGLFAVQDRTIGEGIDDAMASQTVKTRLMAADASAFREVDVEVAEGAVLLSGPAPSEGHRQMADTITRSIPNVHTVYNEIVVAPRSSMMRNASDEMITAQIRTRLTASPNVRAVNVNIETYNGNVYLMGTARTQEELERAAEIASRTSGVQRVVSFMRVRSVAPPNYAQYQPPAPEYRGDDLQGAPMGGPVNSAY